MPTQVYYSEIVNLIVIFVNKYNRLSQCTRVKVGPWPWADARNRAEETLGARSPVAQVVPAASFVKPAGVVGSEV